MRVFRTGRTRAVTASGILLGAALLASAAAITDSRDSLTLLDGSQNRFDLVVAGSAEPDWAPGPAQWVQGNPDAYRISLTPDDSSYLMSPGDSLNVRIAVRNESPKLASAVELEISDPQDRSTEIDPVTGNFVDLFPQLRFTVADGDRVLLDTVPSTELTRLSLDGALLPDEHRVLDVRIEVPADLDNRWQLAETDVQFSFTGSNT